MPSVSALYPAYLDSDLILKPLKAADAVDLFTFVEANRSYLEEFDPYVGQFRSVEDTYRILGKIQKLREQGRRLSCGIWERGEFIGFVNGVLDWENKTVQIGYGLAKDRQGRGIVTRAIKVVLAYAFDVLEMQSAWLLCWVTNGPSIRVAERLGFKRESRLVPADPGAGQMQPEYKYVLTRS